MHAVIVLRPRMVEAKEQSAPGKKPRKQPAKSRNAEPTVGSKRRGKDNRGAISFVSSGEWPESFDLFLSAAHL